jgi:hypothetical protein
LIPEVLGAPTGFLVPKNVSDGELVVWIYADAAAAGLGVTYPFPEIPLQPTTGCDLLTRFNVVAYACRGDDLSLEQVRAAMNALGDG